MATENKDIRISNPTPELTTVFLDRFPFGVTQGYVSLICRNIAPYVSDAPDRDQSSLLRACIANNIAPYQLHLIPQKEGGSISFVPSGSLTRLSIEDTPTKQPTGIFQTASDLLVQGAPFYEISFDFDEDDPIVNINGFNEFQKRHLIQLHKQGYSPSLLRLNVTNLDKEDDDYTITFPTDPKEPTLSLRINEKEGNSSSTRQVTTWVRSFLQEQHFIPNIIEVWNPAPKNS